MDKNLISVVVPIYKVEMYLEKCVESIANQTYKNLEIILVDDGSPDECPKICDKWAKKDNRIKVIHKENGGVSSARNVGLDNATGEYVAFVDSDDYIDASMYEKLISKAKETNSDMTMSGFLTEDEKGNRRRQIELNLTKCNKNNLATFYTYAQSWHKNNDIYTDNIMGNVWRVLYKNSFIGSQRFPEEMVFCEDLWFNISLLTKQPIISIVEDYLYIYFQRANSFVHSYDEVKFNKRLDFARVVIDKISSLVDEDTLCAYKFQLYFHFITEFAISKRKDLLEEFKKKEWLQLYNCKKNYTCKQKITKLFKYKVANWLVYKKWFKLFFILFNLR